MKVFFSRFIAALLSIGVYGNLLFSACFRQETRQVFFGVFAGLFGLAGFSGYCLPWVRVLPIGPGCPGFLLLAGLAQVW